MLVSIYAVTIGNSTTWHYTICPSVDRAHWLPKQPIFVSLEPSIPLFYAKQWLDGAPLSLTDSLTLMTDSIQQFAEQSSWPKPLIRQLRFKREFIFQPSLKEDNSMQQFDESQWMQMCNLIQGRSLIASELQLLLRQHQFHHAAVHWQAYVQLAILHAKVRLLPGIQAIQRTVRKWIVFHQTQFEHQCTRCGADSRYMSNSVCETCGFECAYCHQCLQMGRSKQCSILICGGESDNLVRTRRDATENHTGTKLTTFQKIAADAVITFLHQNRQPTFLLWAVTGAGKTEMMFPILQTQLQAGRKIALVTPRKDVVLELHPRIIAAFSEVRVVALYGGSPQTWQDADIVIATTHQMLRFFEAFDTVIIDEMDAFPFHNNPMLEYAVKKSMNKSGQSIWLTATPPAHLIRQIRRGRIPYAIVPQRFHGYPLPVPIRCPMSSLREQIQGNRLSRNVLQCIQKSLLRGAQLFIFVPQIRFVEPVVELLQGIVISQLDADFKSTIMGTSSKDEQRTMKVQAFRAGQINILVTTTILERGVTVPSADVIILEADHSLFDCTSLIQMAGRAGRSATDPKGNVWFCSEHWTAQQRRAIRQIKRFNNIADGESTKI
jgi:competence protein ComFA